MKDILLINPPLKKSILDNAGNDLDEINLVIEDNLLSSMNVGLVSIASYLESRGYTLEIIDLYNDQDYQKLVSALRQQNYRFAGISCVTGFSYPAALACMKIIKNNSPETVTIAGGAHIGPLGKTALLDCSQIDIVVQYEGELVLEMILDDTPWKKIPGIVYQINGVISENNQPGPLIDINLLPPFNFALYPDFQKYLPFIEESRGCNAGCNFCVNCFINQRKIRIKKPDIFERDLAFTVSLFGKDCNYIVESLSFGVNPKNTLAILEVLKKQNIKWGSEFRADCAWEKFLKQMYDSGCQIFDIGIESASPKILKLMNKTQNPQRYLAKASSLLKKLQTFEKASVSYNILFFLGESPATMKETLNFVFFHQSPRTMLSAFPVFLYPGVPLWKKLSYFEQNFGSRVINSGYWNKIRAYPVDLSSTISFDEALYFSKLLQRMFLLGEDFVRKSLLEKNGDIDWTNCAGEG